MKRLGKIRFRRVGRALALIVIVAAITVSVAIRSNAQSDPSVLSAAPVNSTLYSFGDLGSNDGTVPKGSLTFDGTTIIEKPIDNVIETNHTLYGMTSTGGAHNRGAIVPVLGD